MANEDRRPVDAGPGSAGRAEEAGPFAALLATAGVGEEVALRSRFGFMAFHGGALEEVTDVVAAGAARAAGASYYGVLHPPDLDVHVPSILVRPAESAALRRFLAHVEVVVAVHGYGRRERWTELLVGGSNRELADHLADHLRPVLAGYEIVTDLDAIPTELRGLHRANPVNLPPGGGVQLELPPRVRGRSPLSPPPGPDGLSAPTRALIGGLAAAARTWAPTPLPEP
jgi:phage replication-related protein YjqB (UPF0714/DUF867 family)